MGAGPLVTAAVLTSAVLHAGWNALAHRVPDPLAAMTLIGLGLTAVSLPMAGFAPAPAAASWPYLGVSVALHVGYTVALAHSYRLGDFSQVYPLARGSAPLMVTLAAFVFVGERLSIATLAGVTSVCAGLAMLVWAGPAGPAARNGHRRNPKAVAAAAATGLCVAAYTVVDGIGVRLAGGGLGYPVWLLGLDGVATLGFAAVWYGRKLPSALGGQWWLAAAGGVLSWASYALVLWAQTRGQLAAVAALRETGVIVAAVLGTLVFGERFGRQRIAATVLVAAGVVLLNVRVSAVSGT